VGQALSPANYYFIRRLHHLRMGDDLHSPDDLGQEPCAPFSLINPYFDQACRGDIVVPPAKFVRRAQECRQAPAIFEQLGERSPIPLEVVPESLRLVEFQLDASFNVTSSTLRMAEGKDGPVVTESGNLILDVTFAIVRPELDGELNSVVGVVGSGLFVQLDAPFVDVLIRLEDLGRDADARGRAPRGPAPAPTTSWVRLATPARSAARR